MLALCGLRTGGARLRRMAASPRLPALQVRPPRPLRRCPSHPPVPHLDLPRAALLLHHLVRKQPVMSQGPLLLSLPVAALAAAAAAVARRRCCRCCNLLGFGDVALLDLFDHRVRSGRQKGVERSLRRKGGRAAEARLRRFARMWGREGDLGALGTGQQHAGSWQQSAPPGRAGSSAPRRQQRPSCGEVTQTNRRPGPGSELFQFRKLPTCGLSCCGALW